MESTLSTLWFIITAVATVSVVASAIVGLYIYGQMRKREQIEKFEADAKRKGLEKVVLPQDHFDHTISSALKRLRYPKQLEHAWVPQTTIAKWKQARTESMNVYQSTRKKAWKRYAERQITGSQYQDTCVVAQIQYSIDAHAYEHYAVMRGLSVPTARLLRVVLYDHCFPPITIPPELSPLRSIRETKPDVRDVDDNVIPFRYPV